MTQSPDRPDESVRRLLRRGVTEAVDGELPALGHPGEMADDDERTQAEYDDPVRFRRRFGFSWPGKARRQLLFFQTDFRLSDGQIRRLHAAKTLDPAEAGLRIRAHGWEAILGWAHILVLAIVFGPMLVLGFLAYGFRLTLQAWLGIGLVMLSVVSLVGAYYAMYVAPWRLKERVRREQG